MANMTKANDLARDAENVIGETEIDLDNLDEAALTPDQIIAVAQVHTLRALTAAVLSIYWEMPDK